MTPTKLCSLHRFVPRSASEMTDFGYEVLANGDADCVTTLNWAECWCPDAARFVLIDAPADLTAETAGDLISAISDSHLGRKIRLVCDAKTLADDELISLLRRYDIGYLLGVETAGDVQTVALKGAIGVRLGAERFVGAVDNGVNHAEARATVAIAHGLGLRVLASQINAANRSNAWALGFDYVSVRDEGFVPVEPDFPWLRKPV